MFYTLIKHKFLTIQSARRVQHAFCMSYTLIKHGFLTNQSARRVLSISSLFQALGCWGRAKASGRKNEGGLSLALVLPHFFSCPCFHSSSILPRAWNRLIYILNGDKTLDILEHS